MDPVQRHYAHTALRGTDPLQGLAPDVRRAILTIPPTIRERLRLAPWRTAETRRSALADIIAERRLAYSLQYDTTPDTSPVVAEPVLGPYYRHRLAMASLADARYAEDLEVLDSIHSAEYRAGLPAVPYAHEPDTHAALLQIQLERARLDMEQIKLLIGAHEKGRAPDATQRTKPGRVATKTKPHLPLADVWRLPPDDKPKTRGRGR